MELPFRSDDDVQLNLALEQRNTRSWAQLMKHTNVEVAVERLSEFYSNVAILSGLLAIFAATEFVNPPETDGILSSLEGIAGALAFCCFLGSVVECVLMSNTVKRMCTEPAFISFLLGESLAMGLATWSFIGGCVFLTLELAAITWMTHTTAVAMCATCAMTLLFSGLLVRFCQLSAYSGHAPGRRHSPFGASI